MSEKTMIEAIRECLTQEMQEDDRVVVIGEDVGVLGGVFRATDGLQAKFGKDRVVDMPLAEGVIVGSGIGLAISGTSLRCIRSFLYPYPWIESCCASNCL